MANDLAEAARALARAAQALESGSSGGALALPRPPAAPQWQLPDPRLHPWMWQSGLGAVMAGGGYPFWPMAASSDMPRFTFPGGSFDPRAAASVVFTEGMGNSGSRSAAAARVVEVTEEPQPAAKAARPQAEAPKTTKTTPAASAPKVAAKKVDEKAKAPQPEAAVVSKKAQPCSRPAGSAVAEKKSSVDGKQKPAPAPPETCPIKKAKVPAAKVVSSSSSEYESEADSSAGSSSAKKVAAGAASSKTQQRRLPRDVGDTALASAGEAAGTSKRHDKKEVPVPPKEGGGAAQEPRSGGEAAAAAKASPTRRKRNGEPKPDTSHPLWKGFKRMSRSRARAIQDKRDKKNLESVQKLEEQKRQQGREVAQRRPASPKQQAKPCGDRPRQKSQQGERGRRGRRSAEPARRLSPDYRRSRSNERRRSKERRREPRRARLQSVARGSPGHRPDRRQEGRDQAAAAFARGLQHRQTASGWQSPEQAGPSEEGRSKGWGRSSPATGANLVETGWSGGTWASGSAEAWRSRAGSEPSHSASTAGQNSSRYQQGLSKNQKRKIRRADVRGTSTRTTAAEERPSQERHTECRGVEGKPPWRGTPPRDNSSSQSPEKWRRRHSSEG